MPTKDPPFNLAKLFYSADGGETFLPFDGIKTVEITEEIINCQDKIPSYWPDPMSFKGSIIMTKQQRKKSRRSWKRLVNRINRDIHRLKRYKEAMRRLKLKMGGYRKWVN